MGITLKISKISFWSIWALIPTGLAILIIAEQGILDEKRLHLVGDIFAVAFLFAIAGLWFSSVIRLVKGWPERSDKRNWILAVLLFFGTIIGSIIFYVCESPKCSTDKNTLHGSMPSGLSYRSSRLVRRIFWLCILFWPIVFIAGFSARLEGAFFQIISFFASILVIPCALALVGIWGLGVYRLISDWRMRTATLNFGYLMLLVFTSFLGGMVFCLIDEKEEF